MGKDSRVHKGTVSVGNYIGKGPSFLVQMMSESVRITYCKRYLNKHVCMTYCVIF